MTSIDYPQLFNLLNSKYNEYKIKYSEIILDRIFGENSLEESFSTIDEMIRSGEYIIPKNPEEFYNNDEWELWENSGYEKQVRIDEKDLDIYFLVRSSSKYLDYVLETFYENNITSFKIYERIFLTECYIIAILKYTEKFVTYFNLKDEFLQIYKNKFGNHKIVCKRFFLLV